MIAELPSAMLLTVGKRSDTDNPTPECTERPGHDMGTRKLN